MVQLRGWERSGGTDKQRGGIQFVLSCELHLPLVRGPRAAEIPTLAYTLLSTALRVPGAQSTCLHLNLLTKPDKTNETLRIPKLYLLIINLLILNYRWLQDFTRKKGNEALRV